VPNLITGTVALYRRLIAKLLGLTAYNVIGEVVSPPIGPSSALIWQRIGELTAPLCRHTRPIYARGQQSCGPLVKALHSIQTLEVRMENEAHGLLSIRASAFSAC